MGNLSRDQAYALAERLVELDPAVCRVNIFPADDGPAYEATVTIDIGDLVSGEEIDDLIAKLDRLRSLISSESGLRLKLNSSAGFVVESDT